MRRVALLLVLATAATAAPQRATTHTAAPAGNPAGDATGEPSSSPAGDATGEPSSSPVGDATGEPSSSPADSPPTPPPWPEAGAVLQPAAVTYPAAFGNRRVFVDAGHGAHRNQGNDSSLCIEEQVFTLRVAEDLARRLTGTGHFTTRVSRTGHTGPSYQARLVQAQAFDAEAIVSLHSDVRGIETAETWTPPGIKRQCKRNNDHPGFAVLYSPEGTPALARQRRELARHLARRLTAAGLLPYDGADYDNAYTMDADVPGAFRANIRLFWLRRPTVPSVIVETHHAWDSREEQAWSAGTPWPIFAAAVAGALMDLWTPGEVHSGAGGGG